MTLEREAELRSTLLVDRPGPIPSWVLDLGAHLREALDAVAALRRERDTLRAQVAALEAARDKVLPRGPSIVGHGVIREGFRREFDAAVARALQP